MPIIRISEEFHNDKKLMKVLYDYFDSMQPFINASPTVYRYGVWKEGIPLGDQEIMCIIKEDKKGNPYVSKVEL